MKPFHKFKQKEQLLENEDEEGNECEKLIALQESVPECSLMVEGYHSIKKLYYFCPCDPDCQLPLCLSCIEKCHKIHWGKKELEEFPTDVRNGMCSCGKGNHILPEGANKGDFAYNENCLFLEWSIVSKTYIFYQNNDDEDQILCMFCYHFCEDKPECYRRVINQQKCETEQCMCTHSDYGTVFDKINKLLHTTPFKFEIFTPIHFFNMILNSKRSFENSFHRATVILNNLSTNGITLKKEDFNFIIFINNSPFINALTQIDYMLDICKSMFYFSDSFDCSEFIIMLLERKFNYKVQDNVWLLKKNILNIFHKINFRKDFESLPILSVKDLSNGNPFQRTMYSDYIYLSPEGHERYFKINTKDNNKNYVDNILHIIEKYKNIKDKNESSYTILKKLYSECKKILRFNQFSSDQCMKFYSGNDEIIYQSLSNKDINIVTGYPQMQMLNQMVKCIGYMAYNFNDNELNKYLKNEISLQSTSFFHSSNETARKIYKNCTNILLYCRSIHTSCCVKQSQPKLRASRANTNDHLFFDQEKTQINETFLKQKIAKFQNKIMFIATDITALTLNYPDAYIYGLRRLIEPHKDIYLSYINNNFTSKELSLGNIFKEMYMHLEKTYRKFFLFEATIEDIEKQIIDTINKFFTLINKPNFQPPFSGTTTDTADKGSLFLQKKPLSIFKKLIDRKAHSGEELHEIKNRILINKTPLIYTLMKSLQMILTSNMNQENKTISQVYFNKLLTFIGFFVYESSDNCLIFLTDKIGKCFLMLETEHIIGFINGLEYMIKILVKKQVNLSQNNEGMNVIEELVRRISDKHIFVYSFYQLLKIISKGSKITYLHQEHTLNKMRKTIKNIYHKNPILQKFRNVLTQEESSEHKGKRISDLRRENICIDGYDFVTLTSLFTKFLKITNYLFDGSSILNESIFGKKVFLKEQIPEILQDLSMYLPLRVELGKFFRITYIDVLIDLTKTKAYVDIFAQDITAGVDSNALNFILFQDLLKVKDTELDMSIESSLLNFELKSFIEVVKQSKGLKLKNQVGAYFEYGIILPLHVFINKYISIIYNGNGYQYIKLYEIVFHFLQLKKYVIEQKCIEEQEVNEATSKGGNFFKSGSTTKNTQFSLITKKGTSGEFNELLLDIQKIQDKNIEILNYKLIYHYFEKNVKGFIASPSSNNLKDIFSKKNKIYSDEEIQETRKEYFKQGKMIAYVYGEKIIDIIGKYENDKTRFIESSLCQNLGEKNVLYATTYRSILLRPMFYLINSESFYLKYRRQNLWQIFRLLQYDTGGTQEDILQLRKLDLDKIKQKLKKNPIKKGTKQLTVNNEDDEDIDVNKPTVNINYGSDLFVQNLLSIIFESCNPSSTSTNEDYTICYMIIKIMKYMCEDHNTQFQTMFFQEIKIETSGGLLNMFELMMCTLSKILLGAKWDKVEYDQDENSISYFYEIFFAMIEFSIEMIQGTPKENILCIINQPDRENEKSFFYKFLVFAKDIVSNNTNNSEIVYNVRLDIINFIAAFVEEKSTPEKIIVLLANLYNPMTIFDSIVNILKKLYLKSIGEEDIRQKINEIELDDHICKYFINKYFSVSEFSQCQEFELANRMYNYVKQLTKYNIKDAKSIIDSINGYTEQQLIDLRTKKVDKNAADIQQNSETVMIDPKYCQNYFAVKFFDAITRTVWIQGEEKNSQMVLFTLDPTVLFGSENTKNNFYQNVHRDSRSSKLFELMEYTTYFFLEINHNKKRGAGNFFFKMLNHINFSYGDQFLFLLTAVINILILVTIESTESENFYQNVYTLIYPFAIIQLMGTILCLLLWFLSKFKGYFLIEKEKYYLRNRKSTDEGLNIMEYITIVIIDTLLQKKEIVSFIWNLIFSGYGIISSKNIYIFSFQLLILVNINETLQNIAKAIVLRYKQLLTTFMFLIVAIYVFSTLAFFLLSRDFIHEGEGNQENTCGSLGYCFFTHLEFGLRTDGGIGEFIKKTSFLEEPSYFMGMFFYQFVFFIVIIVVMLAVIGGNVIDTFAELREKSQNNKYDMNNICFICNGSRNEIQKQGENFEEHVNKVHHIWTYVDYMIGLKFVDPQETNAINSFVLEKLEDKKISWFPSFKSSNENNEEE